jgi:hypothetical protein
MKTQAYYATYVKGVVVQNKLNLMLKIFSKMHKHFNVLQLIH